MSVYNQFQYMGHDGHGNSRCRYSAHKYTTFWSSISTQWKQASKYSENAFGKMWIRRKI